MIHHEPGGPGKPSGEVPAFAQELLIAYDQQSLAAASAAA
jgi:hypothetical protein